MDVNEKYMLTVKEAAEYYNIDTKSLRRIVENGEKKFAVSCTNKVMIIRKRNSERRFPAKPTSFLARIVKNLMFLNAQITASVKNRQERVIQSKL